VEWVNPIPQYKGFWWSTPQGLQDLDSWYLGDKPGETLGAPSFGDTPTRFQLGGPTPQGGEIGAKSQRGGEKGGDQGGVYGTRGWWPPPGTTTRITKLGGRAY